jgi:hypothetical protein
MDIFPVREWGEERVQCSPESFKRSSPISLPNKFPKYKKGYDGLIPGFQPIWKPYGPHDPTSRMSFASSRLGWLPLEQTTSGWLDKKMDSQSSKGARTHRVGKGSPWSYMLWPIFGHQVLSQRPRKKKVSDKKSRCQVHQVEAKVPRIWTSSPGRKSRSLRRLKPSPDI